MICAIVLAAGQSRRMGTQKLLLPFAGKTVIAHIVDEVLASAAGPVLVVTTQGSGVADVLSGRNATIVVNPDSEGDMLSSVRCGLRALPDGCEAVLVMLGDQPSVSTGLIDQVIGAFGACERKILVPVYRGKRGHPLLFSVHYREEILAHYDEDGLRGLLHAHPNEVFELATQSSAVLADMDYPGDYLAALQRYSIL